MSETHLTGASSAGQGETTTMFLVFTTILISWIGFSLPYPVFSHLFLNDSSPLSGLVQTDQRTFYLGAAIAIYPLGQIIGAPLLGSWSDKYGRRPVLILALAVAVLGSAILTWGVMGASLWMILLGRFVAGLGEGNIAILQSLASDVSRPESKARNFALIGIAMDLGFVVGPVLGGLLAWDPDGGDIRFAAPFVTAAGLFLFNLILVPACLGFGKTIGRKADHDQDRLRLSPRLFKPVMIRLMSISFLTYWAVMIFFDFFPVYFLDQYQTGPVWLGINAALLSVPLILSGLIVGRLVNRWGTERIQIGSFLLMSLGTTTFLMGHLEWHHVIPAILVCFGINFGQTASSVLVSEAAGKEEQGRILGLYRSATVLASGLAALAGGWTAGAGIHWPFLTGILACLLGLILMPGMTRQLR